MKPKSRLFFLFYDSPFFWVRAGAFDACMSATGECDVRKFFQTRRFSPDCLLVFNRFAISRFHRAARWLLRKFRIPYVFDLDDLYWELPGFSRDTAGADADYVALIDRFIAEAATVTTPSVELRERLNERFPGKRIVLVENAPPPWMGPKVKAIIANTDSFKMDERDLGWFVEVLEHLVCAGVGVQLIGENHNLLARCPGLGLQTLPRLDYDEYLQALAYGGYSLGLIPVGHSKYAECKSAIKAMEFLENGIPVVASDIAPYARLQKEFPGVPLTVVENTRAAWLAAVDRVLSAIPQETLAASRAAGDMMRQIRQRQVEQWRSVVRDADFSAASQPGARLTAALLTAYRVLRAPVEKLLYILFQS